MSMIQFLKMVYPIQIAELLHSKDKLKE